MSLREDIAPIMKGEVSDMPEDLLKHSRDTSIFEKKPLLVTYPQNAEAVAHLVQFVHEKRVSGELLSLTARAAGTDMTGGPLTHSIVVSFTRFMNRLISIGPQHAVAEPGMYYRDFEKQTLAVSGAILPSYPASRELAALGGIVSNNSGGELTLKYGKTADYIEELDIVLDDGSTATLKPLTSRDLEAKCTAQNREGEIYRGIRNLVETHTDEIEVARPQVTKNSVGYALWDVWNKERGTFDLTKLVVGAQGTLGLWTKARIKLVKLEPHRAMIVVFLSDIHLLPEVVKRVLKHKPESFESYDDHTFKLAVRFLPKIIGQLGFVQMLKLGAAFLPELWMVATGGVPRLVLMAEFSASSPEAAREQARHALEELRDVPVRARQTLGAMDSKKYWIIRRESFALLRKNLHGFYASPFIDDLVVNPENYPEFIPELNALLKKYDLIYTIAGHIGNGNFHIIPLMNLADPQARETILELTPKVYELVKKYHGSTTGEHNDGIIRTPYLKDMFSPTMLELFAEVKRIFDPLNIFNPGKKVGGTEDDIRRYMITSR